MIREPSDTSPAEQPALGATPQPYHTLWHTSPDALALTDGDGMVLAANPAYGVLHGYKPADLVGQSWAVILPEATRAEAMVHYRTAMESRDRPHTYPAVTQWRDAAGRAVESRLDLGRLPDGRPVLLSSVHVVAESGPERSSPTGPVRYPRLGAGTPTAAKLLIDAIQRWGVEVVLATPDAHDRS